MKFFRTHWVLQKFEGVSSFVRKPDFLLKDGYPLADFSYYGLPAVYFTDNRGPFYIGQRQGSRSCSMNNTESGLCKQLLSFLFSRIVFTFFPVVLHQTQQYAWYPVRIGNTALPIATSHAKVRTPGKNKREEKIWAMGKYVLHNEFCSEKVNCNRLMRRNNCIYKNAAIDNCFC